MIRLFIVTDLKIYKHILLHIVATKCSFCQYQFSYFCGKEIFVFSQIGQLQRDDFRYINYTKIIDILVVYAFRE